MDGISYQISEEMSENASDQYWKHFHSVHINLASYSLAYSFKYFIKKVLINVMKLSVCNRSIKCCLEKGIKDLTISSNSTGMIRVIMDLGAYGCHLNDTAIINRANRRIDAKQIPAFKIEIL